MTIVDVDGVIKTIGIAGSGPTISVLDIHRRTILSSWSPNVPSFHRVLIGSLVCRFHGITIYNANVPDVIAAMNKVNFENQWGGRTYYGPELCLKFVTLMVIRV
jgi:hypothetical protein